jgi:hypothetical protein
MARIGRLLGVALALWVGSRASPARADDDTDRAEQAFRQGNGAFAAGDYHAAFDAYRTAWSLKQTFDIACNLGRTEVELSLSRDAAEHLDYCLRTFSVSSRGDVRDANKRFRELFQRVRRQVGALSVEVRPAGAEITVDGASYGVAPIGHDIFLTPGTHLVKARLSGFLDEDRSVVADPGGSLNVTFALTPVARGSAAAPVPRGAAPASAPPLSARPAAPGAPARETATEPRTIVVISGAAASVIALGVGIGFTLDAGAARDRASKLGASVHTSSGAACGPGASLPDCVSLRDAVDHEHRSRDGADIALMTGAILGVSTLAAWLIIPDLARSEVGVLRASPWVGRGGSGVALTGAY